MRVPEEAGQGLARLKFSFAAWEGADVAGSTIEPPIVGPEHAADEERD